MKHSVKMIAFSTLIASAMMLSACSSNNDNNANNANSPDTQTDTNTNAPQNNADMPSDSNSGNEPSNSDNTGNDNGTSGNAASGEASGNTAGGSADQGDGDAKIEKEIKALLALAKDGKVNGIEFAAHDSLIDDVEKAWGKADKTDSAGKGIYATYSKKHAVIGFNKGSRIFDVRSDDSELQKLTLDEITAALGKADGVTKNGTDTIYMYKAGSDFQLKFVIAKSTAKVDHINVYSPADTVNNMAG